MREIDEGWIDRVCDDVLSRFPGIISKLGEGFPWGVTGDGGSQIIEGHGCLRVEGDSGLGIEGWPKCA